MIRKLKNIDINRVADIWLKTNLKAHYFISEQYWTSNYELVKEMMSQAEVYVYEDDKMIQGFVGLSNEYIEGIFVSDEMQSCGIGKLLLDYTKNKKVRLRLNVYQKNTRALSFYQREEFNIQCEGFDGATGEKEYPMLWQQKQKAILGRIPMDIANMVLFLCSEKVGFITGENICIDGGMTKQMIYHGDCGWRFDI